MSKWTGIFVKTFLLKQFVLKRIAYIEYCLDKSVYEVCYWWGIRSKKLNMVRRIWISRIDRIYCVLKLFVRKLKNVRKSVMHRWVLSYYSLIPRLFIIFSKNLTVVVKCIIGCECNLNSCDTFPCVRQMRSYVLIFEALKSLYSLCAI